MSYEPPIPDAPRAAPGWYPVEGATQRYWDGYEWTNNLAPLTAGQQLQQGIGENDRLYAMAMHLGGLFVSFLVPLIMWLIKKQGSPFIDHHGRQAMNFHLTAVLAFVASVLLVVVGIGILMIPIVVVSYFVFGVIAGVKAHGGDYYRIPVAIPFFG